MFLVHLARDSDPGSLDCLGTQPEHDFTVAGSYQMFAVRSHV